MGTSLSRTFPAVLAAPLAAALLAGCGGPSEGGVVKATDVPAAPARIPKITTAVIEPVPVEAYLLTEEQWTTLGKAEHALRVRCMERFGFAYEEPLPVGEASGQTISQYRYGKLDPAKTAVHGYRMPPAPSSSSSSGEGRKKPTAAERVVLSGTADLTAKSGKGGQKVNGGTVPDGGCVGEAQRKLGDYGDAQVADDVNLGSFGKSLKDGRVHAVFAKWSRCMAESGYRYENPMDASEDEKWRTETPSAEEKTVATVDAHCKIKNNVAGVWYAVDVAYQKQAIEEHAEELDQVRKAIAGQLKTAADVLGD
ncbi:hypothetical protein AB0M38_06805 [Streptomyces sp. NPDC051742]|uniref:hypothetical protein n=1 Tax=unclassified Streptomyces TaxID=2593676 RepID=UPI003415B0F2